MDRYIVYIESDRATMPHLNDGSVKLPILTLQVGLRINQATGNVLMNTLSSLFLRLPS